MSHYVFFDEDGNDTYTVLLLHCDGANGSSIFTDSSPSVHSISDGSATITTSTPKYGSGGASFATVAGLSFTDNLTDLSWPGDFTVDFWLNTSTVSTDGGAFRRIISFDLDSATSFQLYLQASGFIVCRSNATLFTGATNTANGTYHHIAVTRSGTTLRLFVDGVQDASVTNSTSFAAGATARIGSYNGTTGRIAGTLDEIRVSKGIARWTAGFTPPATQYA